MSYKALTDVRTNALKGGAVTYKEKPLLDFGAFSDIKNMRARHPGFKKRLGQIKLHSTADGTNEIINLYQFAKSRVSENHFYAQVSDGDLTEATNTPPIVTAGIFGGVAHAGTTGQIPASFGNLNDILIYSNGVDQHQIYGGNSSLITQFIVYIDDAAIPNIPVEGKDLTLQVTDGRTTTSGSISSLGTLAAYDCIFIRTPVQIDSLTFTMNTVNTTAGVAQIEYWNGDSWASVTGFSDGTTTGGAAFGQTGAMTFTAPTAIQPKYAFGANDWWYRVSLDSGATDSDTSVRSVVFDSNFHDLVNVWDGVAQPAIEAWFYDDSAGTYNIFGGSSVDLDEMTISDKCYFASTDPITAFYLDPGENPSAETATIDEVAYWDGHTWKGIVADDSNTVTDGTTGVTQAGWVTFPRPTNTPQPLQFQGAPFYLYWYYFEVSATLTADTNVSIQVMPYFDINELGLGRTNAVWKSRAVYSFDRWAEYIYFSTSNAPYMLNGSDYGILEAGDGRSNKVVAMCKFHNELMVWQEELGAEGGCLSLVEGNHPTNFGTLMLSTKIGTFSNKSVVQVDGVLTSTTTDERVKHLVFFLSRYGVCVTDGRTVNIISDDIQNYFNPNEPEAIRRGYESKMWIGHDARENVLRIGLVSGSSATNCNIFPVYDLTDKVWYFDTPAQELSCMTQVGAGSGNAIVNEVGGGIDDGTVYLLNSGSNDVSTAIDAFVRLEFGNIGEYFTLRELLARWKSQETGDIYIEVFVNGVSKFTEIISMQAANFGEIVSRVRKSYGVDGHQISIKIGNSEVSQALYLEDVGVGTFLWKKR